VVTALLTLMRRLMKFILSVGLICAGIYILYEELFIRYSGIHGRYQPFGVGLIFISSGVVRLWYDFLGPVVIRRIIEKRAKVENSLPE
jgi:hypothetical protein